VVNGQINPELAANNIRVIKDTHGKTSHLSASDLDALIAYLLSNSGAPSSLVKPTTTTTASAAIVPGWAILLAATEAKT